MAYMKNDGLLKPERTMDFIDRTAWVCQCGHECCEPGYTFGPAVRDHFLFHFAVHGRGVLHNEHGDFPVEPGQGFFISPEETTVYAADLQDPWEYYWIGFKGDEAREILRGFEIDPVQPVVYAENSEAVLEIFEKMIPLYQTPSHSRYELMAYLYLILAQLHNSPETGRHRVNVAESYFEQARRYIRDNYAYAINVEDIAAHVGIDRTYLYRIFMERLQISPANYLLRVRMERARQLLMTTRLPVYQIALSTGYSDISHFSGTFKKYFGTPPSRCRGERVPAELSEF